MVFLTAAAYDKLSDLLGDFVGTFPQCFDFFTRSLGHMMTLFLMAQVTAGGRLVRAGIPGLG